MAYFDNKRHLAQLSSYFNFTFTHICTAIFNHHVTTVFPVNILLLVLDDDGKNDCFFEDLSTGEKLPLLKDHIYFFPCGMRLKIDITPGITTLALHFNLMYLHIVDVFSGSRRCGMHFDPALTKKIRTLVNAETDKLKSICELQSAVMHFSLPFRSEDNLQTLLKIQKYETTFQFIHKHGDARLSVGQLAEINGRRQDVFSRAFSRDVGKSPKKFIEEDLIRKISIRLLLPYTSVKQVAAELKFSSEFYMSNFFKKHIGISPREYQEKFRN